VKCVLVALGRVASKEVVTTRVNLLGTKKTLGWGCSVEHGEIKLPTEENAIGIIVEAVSREATRKGVHQNACCQGEEGGKNIQKARWQGGAKGKEAHRRKKVVGAAGEAEEGSVDAKVVWRESRRGCCKREVL
jgi:hypothetical protein